MPVNRLLKLSQPVRAEAPPALGRRILADIDQSGLLVNPGACRSGRKPCVSPPARFNRGYLPNNRPLDLRRFGVEANCQCCCQGLLSWLELAAALCRHRPASAARPPCPGSVHTRGQNLPSSGRAQRDSRDVMGETDSSGDTGQRDGLLWGNQADQRHGLLWGNQAGQSSLSPVVVVDVGTSHLPEFR